MSTENIITAPLKKSQHLAKLAWIISQQHLTPFTRFILQRSKEEKLPVLKFFSAYTPEQFEQMSLQGNAEWLSYLAKHQEHAHLELTVERWVNNQLPKVQKEQLVIEDITLAAKIRKESLLHFIPEYTTDLKTALLLVSEIDEYMERYSRTLLKTYSGLLEARIQEQLNLNEAITASIKESESLYREAQAITHIGNYWLDVAKNKLTWSDELYRIYGLSPGDNIDYQTIADFNHPDDASMVAERMQHALKTLEPFDFHYRIRLNNENKILHARGRISGDASGKAIKVMGTAQDVTERQTLIHKLQHSDELYKQAQALAHIGNWEWDIRGNKVTWSDEMYRIFGIRRDSQHMTVEDYFQMVHPDDLEHVKKETSWSLEHKAPNDFYHRIKLNEEVKVLHARSEVIHDDDGKPAKLIGTAQDVTAQKEIEQKLRENQTFIQKIADATPSIIASYNINTGKYVFINYGIKKLLGYEPNEVLDEGVPFFIRIIHPEDLEPIMSKNGEAIEKANQDNTGDEIIAEFQYRMRHRNGEYRWFHTFGTVFNRNEKNQVEHILSISLDITDRVKAEQVLHQRTLELQQSNANLEEFAFVASHDLKEPLRKISTFSDRLLNAERSNVSPQGLDYLQRIMSSSIRLQQMVTDLLSLSMISGEKSFRRTSLQKIWEEVLVALETKIEETNAKVESDGLPEAMVVPSQFRQLFQNLLSNSLKFAVPGRQPVIRISHSVVQRHDLEVMHLKEAKKYLKITISDNGIGFDNVYVEKIFAIFQRLHAKEAYEGTGIGLSVCKKIIENHGGLILGSGTPDKGASFTVIIPD